MNEDEKVLQITVDGAGVFPGDKLFVSMITNAMLNSTRIVIYNCNHEIGRSACNLAETVYRWSPERYAYPRPLFGTEGNKALFGITPNEVLTLELVGFHDLTESNTPPVYYVMATCVASSDEKRLYYRLTIINTITSYVRGWDEEMFTKDDMNAKIAELVTMRATNPSKLAGGIVPKGLSEHFDSIESDGEYNFIISKFIDNNEVKKEEE